MIRIAKLTVSFFLMFILIWFGVLNSHNVNFILLPNLLHFDNWQSFNVPLYLIVILSIFFGFILGCILENIRANKIKKSLEQKNIELKKSKNELNILKKKMNQNNDDILTLLE